MKAAAIAESHSNHPLSSAIMNYAAANNILQRSKPEKGSFNGNANPAGVNGVSTAIGENAVTVAGKGLIVQAVEGTVLVGNRALFSDRGIVVTKSTEGQLSNLERQGKTAVCVGLNDAIIGVVGIADTLKPDAVVTVRRLQNMNIDVHLVTGDNIHTALHCARLVGIPSVSLLRF
jgi:Cu+-exporting ATPase